MVEGGIYPFVIPVARTIAGFMVGVMLGICGGWVAITFSHMVGFPWSPAVHVNMYIVAIGLGAGLGAYLGWMSFNIRWYLIAGSIMLALAGGVTGAYLGLEYGKTADPSYLGRHYTIDNMIHWGASIGGIAVASTLGVLHYLKNMGR